MAQRAEGTIEIEVPVETVYSYWESLENLPNFMSNVEEVTSTGEDTTHWKVKGPFGRTTQWEARTTQKEPNSAIAWNTIDGEVGTSGQVRFRQATPNRTRLEVEMNYADPPRGKVGEAATRVLADPGVQLEQDLQNLKDILEGRAAPEEVRQRPAAANLQSGAVVAGAGLVLVVLLIGIGGRRRGGQSTEKRKIRFIIEL